MTITEDLTTAITALDQRVAGAACSGWEDPEDRAGAQLLAPHRPTVVLEADGAADISRAFAFATDHGMPVAIQATGHGRTRSLESGLLIDTRRMREVRVSPATRTAWVPAGARWQDVIAESAPHGLAPLSGSLPAVGAISFTLGGGLGLLARRHGYSADHVRRFEVVTADGRIRSVSAQEEPELFWALRGGGGNLAAVTGMEIELFPVTELFGGSVMVDLADAPDMLDLWTRWTASVPESMTSAVSVIPFPDLPMIPDDLRGRQVAQLQISFDGPEAEGRRLMEPLLSVGGQLRNTLRTVPYTRSGEVFDEPDRPSAFRGQSVVVDELDPSALTTLARRAGSGGCIVGVRHLGGALSRAPEVPNAVGHRSAQYSVGVLSLLHDGEPSDTRTLHESLLATVAPHRIGRSLNFTFGPLDPDQVRSAYDAADVDRLAEITARYDPYGVLFTNHPIAASATSKASHFGRD